MLMSLNYRYDKSEIIPSVFYWDNGFSGFVFSATNEKYRFGVNSMVAQNGPFLICCAIKPEY